ncbi:hypothetical protein D3C85_1465040 [compost metagenome]
MIRPQFLARMRGRHKRVLWNTDDRLIAIIESQRSIGKSSTDATCWMPALLTRMSMPPNSRSA